MRTSKLGTPDERWRCPIAWRRTHFHSTQSTWQGHCCSTYSQMASSHGCPGRRCCHQTQWASQWDPRSSPWQHDEGLSHEVLLHWHWPLEAQCRNHMSPRKELTAKTKLPSTSSSSTVKNKQTNKKSQSNSYPENKLKTDSTRVHSKTFFKMPKQHLLFLSLWEQS